VHLATHAAANDRNPMFSYISFYPVDSAEYSYKLFTSEIMDLSLEPVKLVILSACETGAGELVKGEGLMSMTRAFSYAGCQNVIASLWKADDKSTAMISSQLHQYLGNDESPAEALRHATLDYINNDDVPLRQKTPAYWAHLRLIGVFENEGTHHYWILITIVCVLISAIVIFYFSRKVLSVSTGSTR
jgi:CHAT domain-containing protein